MSSLPPLASFLITLLLAAAVCIHGEESVRDTNGNEVRIGEQYFIQPINTGSNGGGLVPIDQTFPICQPLGITEALGGEPGVPVNIAYRSGFLTPLKVIKTNLNITIEFEYNLCNELSKFWEVEEFGDPTKPAIRIGGSPKEPRSWFKIEKVKDDGTYKLTTPAGTVGAIPILGSTPRLVLTNDVSKIISVKFIKVNDATTDVTSRVEKLGLRMIPFY
ncbi:Kunitz family trypsin and protease inhibitor protein [Raphanus sativus]|uniref:Kunitz trypsin inhibitor 2-like n=1 Tax=Raphanus sativus TaxID=3726 RepID=A0A6J0L863_RAPSA|nr:kunitz trypsin inhibitor 2-like [Raphanus sativus]KAJ4874932.1 Kunitz family trypsin and protease inhibitor protein [Raphanus sativus]